jgi:hypothetical protein
VNLCGGFVNLREIINYCVLLGIYSQNSCEDTKPFCGVLEKKEITAHFLKLSLRPWNLHQE